MDDDYRGAVRASASAVVFAALSLACAIAALRAARRVPLPLPQPVVSPFGALRAAVDQIAKAAQAGTIGDSAAAQYAFAIIARRAGEAESLIDAAGAGQLSAPPGGLPERC